mgnify:CR=1 FL=1
MKNDAMLNRAKQLVVDYFNAHVDVTDGKKLTIEDVPERWREQVQALIDADGQSKADQSAD